MIVAEGEVVTHDQYQKLQELGFIHTGVDRVPYIGLAIHGTFDIYDRFLLYPSISS